MGRPSNARERIVRAAAAMFIVRSYHGVGIDELCAAADVRKGSFYHFFGSKSELVRAVTDLHGRVILDRLDECAALADPVHGLYAVVDTIVDTQTQLVARFGRVVGCPFGNLAAELSTTDDDVRRHVAATLGQIEKRIAGICDRVAKAGALTVGVTPDQFARTFMAQYHGAVLMAKVQAADATTLAPALRNVVESHLHAETQP